MTGRRRIGSRRLLAGLVGVVLVALFASPLTSPVRATNERRFPTQLARVLTPTYADRDRLTSLGLDLTEHGGEDFVDVVLHTAADASQLVQHGFRYDIVVPDLAAREAQNRRLDAAYAAATVASPLPSGRDAYRTLADYEAGLQALVDENPALVRSLELTQRSLEGRKIRGVEISENVAATSDGKPTFLMLGLHHAREWPSGEHSMEFAIDLLESYAAGDPRIRNLLARTRVVVVPVVNPDGFEQSRKWGDIVDLRGHEEVDPDGTVAVLGTPGNAYKRKNCRAVDEQPAMAGGCEATSPGGFGIGVDLNRNYGGKWGGAGASTSPAHATYRGAQPFSEPETQAVRELISGRQVTTLITNHTYSNLVLRPPGIRANGTTVDEAAMRDLGARMAANNGYRNIQSWQLYDTSGTTEDWSYTATGGFGYTFEIGPDEFHPPFSEVVDEYLGKGVYAGKGNREAYLVALKNAADRKHHSVIDGDGPAGAVLRLRKTFTTTTTAPTADPVADTLESTLTVPANGQFSWHVNPSTRPEVMEHRLRVLRSQPARQETTPKSAVVWRPGDHVDIPFSMPDSGVGALKVKLDWPTPDDLDLYVYYVNPDGSLVEVGSSGNFINAKEEALVDLPEPGDYVLRVVNYASVTTTFTVTAGTYAVEREDVIGGGIVESYSLTCERQDGTVLETVEVTVDRGETQKVDLSVCRQSF